MYYTDGCSWTDSPALLSTTTGLPSTTDASLNATEEYTLQTLTTFNGGIIGTTGSFNYLGVTGTSSLYGNVGIGKGAASAYALDVSGNTNLNGTITLSNPFKAPTSGQLGYTLTSEVQTLNISVSNKSYTNVATIPLEAGVWIITADISFNLTSDTTSSIPPFEYGCSLSSNSSTFDYLCANLIPTSYIYLGAGTGGNPNQYRPESSQYLLQITKIVSLPASTPSLPQTQYLVLYLFYDNNETYVKLNVQTKNTILRIA
jgi:hypothetical protein